jgi:hypothetical protein
MDISAKITGIEYKPLLCKKLDIFDYVDYVDIDKAFSQAATFILRLNNKNQVAISWWVSPKRTRSYPYARVYDSLNFSGKKITIIPIIKDEGKRGDRDFLQWDTVSLMSLLGIYVIIGYYSSASLSSRFENKITDQKFNIEYIKNEVNKLLSYQSDALHWNLSQIDKVGEIAQRALESYTIISENLGIEMHSRSSAEIRIRQLQKGKEFFMNLSRNLAKKAQKRESITIQPKERLKGKKATLTIKNYLGGYYFFTCDEVELYNHEIFLMEGKHTKTGNLPSLGDIKDGLLKMILFTNLKDVKINGKSYSPIADLKLTTGQRFDLNSLTKNQRKLLNLLTEEARVNNFKILINDKFL